MRAIVIPILLGVLCLMGCGKEDAPECDSCIIQNQRVKFCDNGDGTYSMSSMGETEFLTYEELEKWGVNFEELKEMTCAADDIIFK
ncbi:hypothetical protein [Flagellimonas nanhaiensis]|uniref:Uncharacterized protein n=1 Tax=Flagellimonas nanhaiensis TaxID=2292706 RepID=A0A371JQJ4_9FLAO|nr:hypothetical protein [Allomuricauda nanhaiensis]RDY59784.1 hypothetical protein DX873_10505 [Allomuricauda nanhaiensis]